MQSSKSKPKLKPKTSLELTFTAIGTQWSVELYESTQAIADVEQFIKERIVSFDKAYSRFRSDSLITRMSQKAGRYRLPPDAQPMFDLYVSIYEITNGLVTPLIGQVLSDAGYDAAYTLKPRQLTIPPAWDQVLEYEYPYLILKKPALLDVGAMGKGYIVDLIGEVLEKLDITAYCIDAGGDMIYRHPTLPIQVGLEHPADATKVIGVASLQNQSLCGSAGNRRVWNQYHHIINPKTLSSPRHIRAIWVIAETTMLADALTTCLFFITPQKLLKRYNFSYAIVHDDYALEHSANFPGSFFTQETSIK